MYVCSRVYIKNYSRIFLEWIIAKKGWVQIRSLSSAIYFGFMFLSVVTQTCSISSFRSAVLVPLRRALGLGLPSLPRHHSGVGTQLSSALLGWALVVLKRWRVCSSLQMWPYFLVRARGIGDRGWVLGAAYGCSGESRARVPQVSLNWVVQRSFSGTCVCVWKDSTASELTWWEYWWTAQSRSGQAEFSCAASSQNSELPAVRTENENRKLWHLICH